MNMLLYNAIIETVETLVQVERDSRIMSDFVVYLVQNEPVVMKFAAVTTEIRAFIDNYDFQKEGAFQGLAEENMKVVRDQIEIVKQVEELIENTGKTIEIISGYCDRYNKGKVVATYNAVVDSIYSDMCFEDADKYKTQLYDVEEQAQSVIIAFENENKELMKLQATLQKKGADIWREDNEKLVYDINSLVKGDTKKVSFSLEELKKRINDAKVKRSDEIKKMTDKYHWLTREKYQDIHNGLISKYIAHSEYLKEVDSIRKERSVTIWKSIGKAAWSVLKVVGVVFVVLFTVIKSIIGAFLSSHDDD